MSIFLAPVPIVHAQAMLEALGRGHKRFAFGSDAMDFFERNFSPKCEAENITAYIYFSKSGESRIESSPNKQLGVFVKARLCGWVTGDNRGMYPKNGQAHRPTSSSEDGPMALFWEIDNVEHLKDRIPMSEFISATTSKQYANEFVPQGPLLVRQGRV